jgi:hypothetical protein
MQFGFPGLQDLNRQTVRAPINPMDRATVVSICPLLIDEVKPTLQPSRFTVQPGSYEHPSISVIEPASWWRELDEYQPILEIPVSSIVIAESIIRDYCVGLLACDMETAMPGLFSIPGEIRLDRLRKEFQPFLDRARDKQRSWYQALVRLGDALWTRTGGNPMAIADTMRMAANELQLDKPWMKDFATMQMKNCPACGALRLNDYPICSQCRTIVDPIKYKELGLQKAD